MNCSGNEKMGQATNRFWCRSRIFLTDFSTSLLNIFANPSSITTFDWKEKNIWHLYIIIVSPYVCLMWIQIQMHIKTFLKITNLDDCSFWVPSSLDVGQVMRRETALAHQISLCEISVYLSHCAECKCKLQQPNNLPCEYFTITGTAKERESTQKKTKEK